MRFIRNALLLATATYTLSGCGDTKENEEGGDEEVDEDEGLVEGGEDGGDPIAKLKQGEECSTDLGPVEKELEEAKARVVELSKKLKALEEIQSIGDHKGTDFKTMQKLVDLEEERVKKEEKLKKAEAEINTIKKGLGELERLLNIAATGTRSSRINIEDEIRKIKERIGTEKKNLKSVEDTKSALEEERTRLSRTIDEQKHSIETAQTEQANQALVIEELKRKESELIGNLKGLISNLFVSEQFPTPEGADGVWLNGEIERTAKKHALMTILKKRIGVDARLPLQTPSDMSTGEFILKQVELKMTALKILSNRDSIIVLNEEIQFLSDLLPRGKGRKIHKRDSVFHVVPKELDDWRKANKFITTYQAQSNDEYGRDDLVSKFFSTANGGTGSVQEIAYKIVGAISDENREESSSLPLLVQLKLDIDLEEWIQTGSRLGETDFGVSAMTRLSPIAGFSNGEPLYTHHQSLLPPRLGSPTGLVESPRFISLSSADYLRHSPNLEMEEFNSDFRFSPAMSSVPREVPRNWVSQVQSLSLSELKYLDAKIRFKMDRDAMEDVRDHVGFGDTRPVLEAVGDRPQLVSPMLSFSLNSRDEVFGEIQRVLVEKYSQAFINKKLNIDDIRSIDDDSSSGLLRGIRTRISEVGRMKSLNQMPSVRDLQQSSPQRKSRNSHFTATQQQEDRHGGLLGAVGSNMQVTQVGRTVETLNQIVIAIDKEIAKRHYSVAIAENITDPTIRESVEREVNELIESDKDVAGTLIKQGVTRERLANLKARNNNLKSQFVLPSENSGEALDEFEAHINEAALNQLTDLLKEALGEYNEIPRRDSWKRRFDPSKSPWTADMMRSILSGEPPLVAPALDTNSGFSDGLSSSSAAVASPSPEFIKWYYDQASIMEAFEIMKTDWPRILELETRKFKTIEERREVIDRKARIMGKLTRQISAVSSTQPFTAVSATDESFDSNPPELKLLSMLIHSLSKLSSDDNSLTFIELLKQKYAETVVAHPNMARDGRRSRLGTVDDETWNLDRVDLDIVYSQLKYINRTRGAELAKSLGSAIKVQELQTKINRAAMERFKTSTREGKRQSSSIEIGEEHFRNRRLASGFRALRDKIPKRTGTSEVGIGSVD